MSRGWWKKKCPRSVFLTSLRPTRAIESVSLNPSMDSFHNHTFSLREVRRSVNPPRNDFTDFFSRRAEAPFRRRFFWVCQNVGLPALPLLERQPGHPEDIAM